MKQFFNLRSFSLYAILAFFSILTSCDEKVAMQGEDEKDKYDHPDKAAEFQINRTKDPATGKVPSDQMWQAVLYTEQLKTQMRNSSNFVNTLVWDERGSYTDAVGPSNGNTRANNGKTSGRIDAILVDAADASGKTVFIGGDMGGLWKTTDITASPATWTLVNDFMGNLVVSSICQDPTNTNIMYMATGEAYYGGELGVGDFVRVDRVALELLGVWQNQDLAARLGGAHTSPLVTVAAKRFGVDITNVAVTGNGASMLGHKRPYDFFSMAGFEIHGQSGALPAAPTVSVAVSVSATTTSCGCTEIDGGVPGVMMPTLSRRRVESPSTAVPLMKASSIAVAVAVNGLLMTSRYGLAPPTAGTGCAATIVCPPILTSAEAVPPQQPRAFS